MTTQTRIAATVLLLGLLAGGAAFGADSGFYIGGSWGQARPSWDTSTGPSMGATLNSSDNAWGAFGGFQFNKYFSLEGRYINLGKYAISIGNGNQVEPTGWGIAVVGTLPVSGNFSLIGRVGEYRMRQKIIPLDIADNTWSPAFGAGVKYDFSPNFYGRLEYERIQNIGSASTTINEDANVYTLGLGYKFF